MAGYRADEGLAFMLRYENIAWYENGSVRILDRRCYPAETSFVTCSSHREVARAITDMVTQSAGPYTACGMGMALAAWECRELDPEGRKAYLRAAAGTLSNARPTTSGRMGTICRFCLETAEKAIDRGETGIDTVIRDKVVAMNNERYDRFYSIARHLVEKIPDGGHVLTQCFGETVVGMMLKVCREQGKNISLYCCETRPYFQGSRLTATVCSQMGFDTTVITDNMVGYVMENIGIDVFTCASDVITCDGHVVNKVGTMQIAVLAKRFGVPVYVTGEPDTGHPDRASVTIEMRDGASVLSAMGRPTAAEGVRGIYPAFDITPPELVTGIVTEDGIYRPQDLASFLERRKGIEEVAI